VEAAVIVALVTATASLVVAIANGVMARRRETRLATLESELRREESASEREATAEETLERYRGPLLAAAFDLQDRVDNMINPRRDFLAVYGVADHPRRDDAMKSTLYRIGQFFCWVEIVRGDRMFLTFREPEATRSIADLIAGVGRTFADDRSGQEFMLWREEQRAIGERMVNHDGDPVNCVGYATFVERYATDYRRWFERFEATLDRETAMKSDRLVELRRLLRELVAELDPEELRYERWWEHEENSPAFGRPAAPPPPPD
jgi:hypothetical protein